MQDFLSSFILCNTVNKAAYSKKRGRGGNKRIRIGIEKKEY
jgi:hypothetical protein